MPRRNLTHRKTILSWTSDDEPYNDAAMRTFVELFRDQHDEPVEDVANACDQIEAMFPPGDVDFFVNELMWRRIARKMKS